MDTIETTAEEKKHDEAMSNRISGAKHETHYMKSIPFFLVHLLPLGAIWTDIHWVRDLTICFVLYFTRMFFITGVYHRYFAHRSYKMGRVMQFLMAFGGGTSAQKGALWWAAHHRHHHKYSDTPEDLHSPKDGFWWSHMGWILSKDTEDTQFDLIPDFAKYPELRFLNTYHLLPPIILGTAVYCLFGPSALFIGFFLSTVLLYHGTFFINSLAHVFGKRRYVTTDTSRNSFLLALITCGEGWHNNHHHYQSSTNQGFFWWEIDVSYYVLRLLSQFGLVSDLRVPSRKALARRLVRDGYADIGMFNTHLEKAFKALMNAKQSKGELCEERRKAIEALLRSTLLKAEEIASMPPLADKKIVAD